MDIQKMIKEYEPDDSIWNEDSDEVDKIKRAVQKLDDADKIIFLLYAENQSLRKVGKILGCSHYLIFREIKRIKQLIYDYMENNND